MKRHTAKRSRSVAKFCVIGIGGCNRTWLDSEALAVAHAEPMFRKNVDPNANPERLLIVKVVRVIERQPPPLTLREPKDFDFPPQPGSGVIEGVEPWRSPFERKIQSQRAAAQ